MYHSSRRLRVGTVVMKPMAGTVHVSGTCYILVPTYPGRSSNDVAGLSNMPPATTHTYTQHGEELLHSSSHMI